ncbi:hypothetical protein AB6813_10270 [bacterium RCC_150]
MGTDYKILRDFRAFETVNAMRLSLSLDSFRTLATLGTIAVSLLLGLGFVSGMSVLRDGPLRDNAEGVLTWGLLGILYGSVAVVLSEVISSRRLAVSGTPHLELFRAMGLPIQQVALRYGLIPVARRMAPLWLLSTAFLVVFYKPGQHYFGILVAAMSVLLLASSACFYSVVRFASAPARRTGPRWSPYVVTLVLGLILGGATEVLGSQWKVAGLDVHALQLLPPLSLLALGSSAMLIFLSIRVWRNLAYRKILLGSHHGRRGTRSSFIAFVVSDLFSSKQGSVISTIILAWIGISGFLVGANNLLPFTIGLNNEDLQRSLIGLAVLFSLGVSEPMLARIGPAAKLHQYRFIWENGGSAPRIVGSLSGAYLLLGVLVGAFVFFGAFLTLGALVPGAVPASVIVVASGVVAEVLSQPQVSTDGTKAYDLVDSFFTLLLISPCSLILVLNPEYSSLLLLGYSILLTIGVALCLRTRLLKLRLRLIR